LPISEMHKAMEF